jgi:glycerol-3-phosphate dehydrogenase (NAD(P)+)
MSEPHVVAVLGGGSFGTVIANIIACNGNRVRLWLRNSERAASINRHRENLEYLPGYRLHDDLNATTSLEQAVAGVDTVLVAVPSKSFRQVVRELAGLVPAQTLLISLTKGIEASGFRLMSEILREEMPDNPRAVLSGPNLAGEIAAGQVTGSVIASDLPAINAMVHAMLHSESFLIYSSHDMYGVELGGALKNVYAILAGIAAALELGENTVGMLLTRSLAEMSRLFVTCSSPLSRNYRVGMALGKGQPLDEILDAMDQVAEGINTLSLLRAEAQRREVHMPLVTGLYAILYEHRPVVDVFDDMMHTEQAEDVEFVTS